jgi:ribosome maturation factor RimP
LSLRRGRTSNGGGGPRGGRAAGARAGADARTTTGGGAAGAGAAPLSGRDLAALRSRLREIIEPVVTAAGYDVEELSVTRAGRRYLVRLTVDGDGGVSLDAVAVISRQVSRALDAAEEAGGEILTGEYELQVSSPGVDRPLTAPRHWRRNVGRLVQVRVADRQLTGRVLAADEVGIVLDVGGTHHEHAYGELGQGRVQLEFARLAALSDADLENLLEPVATDDDNETDDTDTDDLDETVEDELEEEEDGE